jgi:hypothetical protein
LQRFEKPTGREAATQPEPRINCGCGGFGLGYPVLLVELNEYGHYHRCDYGNFCDPCTDKYILRIK